MTSIQRDGKQKPEKKADDGNAWDGGGGGGSSGQICILGFQNIFFYFIISMRVTGDMYIAGWNNKNDSFRIFHSVFMVSSTKFFDRSVRGMTVIYSFFIS